LQESCEWNATIAKYPLKNDLLPKYERPKIKKIFSFTVESVTFDGE
jgi:hypothetical protein